MNFQDKIILVKKAKPEWQRGLLNLPGGELKPNESPRQCIKREWFEETGIETFESDWIFKLKMQFDNEVTLHAFRAIAKEPYSVNFIIDEPARWYGISWLDYDKCLPDLKWLIPILMDDTLRPGLNIHVGA